MNENKDKDLMVSDLRGLPISDMDAPLLPEGAETYPILKLLQSTSKDGGRPGAFYLDVTGQVWDSVEVIFLKNSWGRIMFGAQLTDPPLCGSNDRIVPSDQFLNPKASACIECPFSRRNYFEEIDVGNKKKKIQCFESYQLIGWLMDEGLPFIFRTKRVANRTVESFLTKVTWDKLKGFNLFNHVAILTSRSVPSSEGDYYAPVITASKMINQEQFKKMFQELQTKTIVIDPEKEEESEMV